MAEQPAEQTAVTNEMSESPPTENSSKSTGGHQVPRGAIAFAVLMIVGYIFYFVMIWSEVVLFRGGS